MNEKIEFYEATYQDGLKVKLENRCIDNLQEIEDLLNEVKVIKDIRHPSIKLFLGITIIQ